MNAFISQLGGPTILIFIGVIISAIGAVWASFDQNRFSDKLEAKNQEIIDLNQKINDSIIGGNSYAYIVPEGNSPSDAVLQHVGEFPLYDVSAMITDKDLMVGSSIKSHTAAISSLQIGNIAPHTASVLPSVFSLTGEKKQYLIQLSARNGHFYENLQFVKVGDKWSWAIKVSVHKAKGKTASSDVVLEKQSDNFPLDKSGAVNWD